MSEEVDRKIERGIEILARRGDFDSMNRLGQILNNLFKSGRYELVRFLLETVDLERFGQERPIYIAWELRKDIEDNTNNDGKINLYNLNFIDVIAGYIPDQDKQDLLTTAIERNNVDVVKILLNHGVEFDETHIDLASELGSGRIVSLLEQNLKRSAFDLSNY